MLATFDNFFSLLKSRSYTGESLTTYNALEARPFYEIPFINYIYLPDPAFACRFGNRDGGGSGIVGGQYVTCILVGVVVMGGRGAGYGSERTTTGSGDKLKKTTNPAAGRLQSNWRVERSSRKLFVM